MKRRDAFTLMEILIVLAILGFGMTLIVEMTTFAARNSERVEEDTVVQLACENLMNSILAGEAVAHVGVSTPIPDAPRWTVTGDLPTATAAASSRSTQAAAKAKSTTCSTI